LLGIPIAASIQSGVAQVIVPAVTGNEARRTDDRSGRDKAGAMMRVCARLHAAIGPCLIGLCLSAAIAAPAEPPRPLRFVTFNLFHGGPFSGLNGDARDLDRRLEMVAEELRHLQPDVVGLQEASTGRGRGNVAARLAAQLGLHHVYSPANPRLFHSDTVSRALTLVLNFSEGPAILSRFRVAAWEAHELPGCGRLVEARTLLSAVLDTPWGALRVFSAHTLGDPCQTQAVADRVQAQRGTLPSVLMGDFNAVEDSSAIGVFTRGVGFMDTFRRANPSQPGLTVWQRIEEATPTVQRRVDYVFLVPGATTRGSVLSSRLVLDTPRRLANGKTLWLSDHYGVMAELEIAPLDSRAGGLRPADPAPGPRSRVSRHR
jgi:endonuclease/exonuclease/phosphatase family metal-dependent hydrolase